MSVLRGRPGEYRGIPCGVRRPDGALPVRPPVGERRQEREGPGGGAQAGGGSFRGPPPGEGQAGPAATGGCHGRIPGPRAAASPGPGARPGPGGQVVLRGPVRDLEGKRGGREGGGRPDRLRPGPAQGKPCRLLPPGVGPVEGALAGALPARAGPTAAGNGRPLSRRPRPEGPGRAAGLGPGRAPLRKGLRRRDGEPGGPRLVGPPCLRPLGCLAGACGPGARGGCEARGGGAPPGPDLRQPGVRSLPAGEPL